MTAQAAPTPPNLALHKPFVCSDPNLSGYLGLTDGSWSNDYPHVFATGETNTFPKTVTTDLGRPVTVRTVILGVPPFGATKTVQPAPSPDNKDDYRVVSFYRLLANREERHAYAFPSWSVRSVRFIYPDH